MVRPLNRTILELKQDFHVRDIAATETLNRTILELKHAFTSDGGDYLIFKSYHFGIETCKDTSIGALRQCFKSYHFGIETMQFASYTSAVSYL